MIGEVVKLRNGIREHRDSSLHDLCWYHPDFWGLLPEKTDPIPKLPKREQFEEGCRRYQESIYGKELADAHIVDEDFNV